MLETKQDTPHPALAIGWHGGAVCQNTEGAPARSLRGIGTWGCHFFAYRASTHDPGHYGHDPRCLGEDSTCPATSLSGHPHIRNAPLLTIHHILWIGYMTSTVTLINIWSLPVTECKPTMTSWSTPQVIKRVTKCGCIAQRTPKKMSKLQPSWEDDLYKVVAEIDDVLYRIQWHARRRMMVVYFDWLAPYKGTSQIEKP
jgi:hypothetical protein